MPATGFWNVPPSICSSMTSGPATTGAFCGVAGAAGFCGGGFVCAIAVVTEIEISATPARPWRRIGRNVLVIISGAPRQNGRYDYIGPGGKLSGFSAGLHGLRV